MNRDDRTILEAFDGPALSVAKLSEAIKAKGGTLEDPLKSTLRGLQNRGFVSPSVSLGSVCYQITEAGRLGLSKADEVDPEGGSLEDEVPPEDPEPSDEVPDPAPAREPARKRDRPRKPPRPRDPRLPEAGTVLRHGFKDGRTAEAIVREDGMVLLDVEIKTISGAAKAAGGVDANPWIFWGLQTREKGMRRSTVIVDFFDADVLDDLRRACRDLKSESVPLLIQRTIVLYLKKNGKPDLAKRVVEAIVKSHPRE